MKRSWWATAVTLIVLSIILDLLLLREHRKRRGRISPGLMRFGLIGIIVIVLISSLLGYGWLEHNENYYTIEGDE